MGNYDDPSYSPPASIGQGAAAQIATAPPTATPRAIAPGQYNPAVYNAKAALDAYTGSVARRLGGLGGPGALNDALVNDPQYQKLQQAHADAQQAHVLGITTPDYTRTRAASDYLSNAAGALSTDAASRGVQAQGQYARDTGQGEAFRGQGAESNARAGATTAMVPFQQAESAANTNRVRELTPVEKAVGYAQANQGNAAANQGNAAADQTRTVAPAIAAQGFANAGATNAGAARVTALTPIEVSQGSAVAGKTAAETGQIQMETKLRPQVLQATQALAAQDRALEQQKTQSEISKNLRNPITGQIDGSGAAVPGAPAPAATPSAAPSPASPGAAPGLVPRAISYMQDNPWKTAALGVAAGGGPLALGVGAGLALRNSAGSAAPTAASPAPAVAGASAPAMAPDRRQLPDGRTVEVVGSNVFQIMPDGTRRLLKVAS